MMLGFKILLIRCPDYRHYLSHNIVSYLLQFDLKAHTTMMYQWKTFFAMSLIFACLIESADSGPVAFAACMTAASPACATAASAG